MPPNKLIFQDAEKARDAITNQQRRDIQRLYKDWAMEISEQARFYENKTTASAPLTAMNYRELERQLIAASDRIASEIETLAIKNIREVSSVVVSTNTHWLSSLGLSEAAIGISFTSVPDAIVHRIVTGQIYKSGWSLSKSIWTDKTATQKQIYEILAGGVARNESIYDMSKLLERYVDPSKRKPWNLKMADGKRIYPRDVDYSSQRLARTMVQHSYQQSFAESIKNNDLIVGTLWDANGSRPCPICQARNGTIYAKGECPLDHPNGQCTMVPVLQDNWKEELAKMF
jgi:hypothetical protein